MGFLLNSAYCLDSLSPALYAQCRRLILGADAHSLLRSEGFVSLHPDLIADLIADDAFQATEERIWSACTEWAQNVIRKKLRFPKKRPSVLRRLKLKEHEI